MRIGRWSSLTLVVAVAGALVAVAAVLAGCGPQIATSSTAKLSPIPTSFDAPVYVVIDDVTSHGASVSAARLKAFDAVLQAAWERRAGLVLITAGSTGSTRTVFSTVAVAHDVNAEFTKRRQANMTRTMDELFQSSDAKQTDGTVDVLAALREAQAQLRSVGNGECQVLVMSPGVLRTPIDVKTHPQFLADPVATAAALKDAGRLPDLKGWTLAFQDAGDLPAEQSQALAALWWNIAIAAGAKLTGYQQAVVDWPLPTMAEPHVPAVVRVPAAADKVILSVSDRVLFDVDQSTLRADAAPVIGQLAGLLLHEYPKAPATITGYTDATGSPAYNLRLSRERAAAVAAALVARGVSSARLTVTGRGASDFVASNATAAGRAANRRTEISVTPG